MWGFSSWGKKLFQTKHNRSFNLRRSTLERTPFPKALSHSLSPHHYPPHPLSPHPHSTPYSITHRVPPPKTQKRKWVMDSVFKTRTKGDSEARSKRQNTLKMRKLGHVIVIVVVVGIAVVLITHGFCYFWALFNFRSRDRQTDLRTDGHDVVEKCDEESKQAAIKRRVGSDSFFTIKIVFEW